MRSVSVLFPSGREVLRSYWGFLDRGGLVLTDEGLIEGDAVRLDVSIKSLKQRYLLNARVVRRASDDGRAFVAFDEGEQQTLMLNAAWADSHDVPQRKHRRMTIDDPSHGPVKYVRVGAGGELVTGQVLDVSPGGCRLRGDASYPVGTRIRVITDHAEIEGQIRWTTPGKEMGIEFAGPERVLEALLPRR
jgi:hypothetical protein